MKIIENVDVHLYMYYLCHPQEHVARAFSDL